MKNAYRLQKQERLSICKNVHDKGEVFVNEIYPMYREAIFEKEFLLRAFPDATFEILENNWARRRITKNSLEQDGIYMLAHERFGKETIVYCGISISDTVYRLERWFKEHFKKSRHDEGHPGAEKFRQYLEEIGSDTGNFDLKMYFTPVLFSNLINKKETATFLTELKKMFIEEFDPMFNEMYINEVTDRASLK